MAVRQSLLEQKLETLVQAGLRPVAVDVEPNALLRCYARQFRRDEDKQMRAMFVDVGANQTAVVVAEGQHVLFTKYIEIGGRQMDEAVAQNLKMELPDAAALRRNNGDRRVELQDPEVARSIAESIRPVIDSLAGELAMCTRYQSVTFRGQPLARLVLGGGEASTQLVEALAERVNVKCELGDPFRAFEARVPTGRIGQWEVAAGLALRSAN
jgi:type IV pilus assembly protein PilM